MKNLDAIGRSDDVLTMTFSEFGRTLLQMDLLVLIMERLAPMFFLGIS